MNIKVLLRITAVTLAALACSCAKSPEYSTYDSSRKVLDAWLRVNYPDAVPSGRGIYVLESVRGDGPSLSDSTYYAFIEYNILDLDGNYIESTDKVINQRLGTYSACNYYGEKVVVRKNGEIYAGLEDILDMMNIGGYVRAVVPSWLLNSSVYDDIDKYHENDPGGGHYIYEVSLVAATDDIYEWEVDTLESFSRTHYAGLDSLTEGYYYKVLKEGPGDTIPNDTTIYIRYIGKLLDGHVFDTNIKDTAIKYGIYNSSTDYDTPAEVKMASSADGITMSGSTVVSGFGETIFRMKKDEEVVSFFWSKLGYGVNGSGNSIPPFSPLVFHIYMTDYEKDE